MSTNKVNEFLDYLHGEFKQEGIENPIKNCCYGDFLWEAFDISVSNSKEILKNPNSKIIDLIDKFLMTEKELNKIWEVLKNVEKITGVDACISEWQRDQIDDIQWSIFLDIFNLKESE